MIDAVKISTTRFDYETLVNQRNLNFQSKFNSHTGEIIYDEYGTMIEKAKFKGLDIVIFNNSSGIKTLLIHGSIHKFYNSGEHNYDDFKIEQIRDAINSLGEMFCFNPSDCRIHNLEIGVNIIPPTNTKTLLEGFLMHWGVRFKVIDIDDAEYYRVKHANYYIKCYDKAKQYRAKGHNISNDIFRFEIKYTKANDLIKYLQKAISFNHSVLTLKDLTDLKTLQSFNDLLLEKWNEIIYYDHTIKRKDVPKSKRKKLDAFQNINRWDKLTKQERYKWKKQLDNIVECYSDGVQRKISDFISIKLQMLLTDESHYEVPNQDPKNSYQLTKGNKSTIGPQRGPINSIYRWLNGNQNDKAPNYLNNESYFPDYDEFHKDNREIPF